MIIVALRGGLGNQLFQYALGRKLAVKNNDTLKLDTTGLLKANEVGDIYRPFALDAFNIKATVASTEESARFKNPYGLLSKLMRRFRFKVLRQQYVGWIPSILKKRGDIYLDGYWQSPKYFEDIRSTIVEDFTLKNGLSSVAQSIADQMKNSNSVSLHVRRGDYVSNKSVAASYGPCTPAYYEAAIATITEKVPNPTWFIFSDDTAWVKESLSFTGEVVYVSDQKLTDQEEILLMASCKHNVIANSTFSWWGAWLNQNPEKIVIVPDPWFDTRPQDHAHLIPDSWIRVPKK